MTQTNELYPKGFPKEARSRSAMLKLGTAKTVKTALEAECARITAAANEEVVDNATQAFLDNVLRKEIGILNSFLTRKRLLARRIIRLDPEKVDFSKLDEKSLDALKGKARLLSELCIEEQGTRRRKGMYEQQEHEQMVEQQQQQQEHEHEQMVEQQQQQQEHEHEQMVEQQQQQQQVSQ
jgi:hypothetical protein